MFTENMESKNTQSQNIQVFSVTLKIKKKNSTSINKKGKKETQVKEIENMFNRIIKGKPYKAGTC